MYVYCINAVSAGDKCCSFTCKLICLCVSVKSITSLVLYVHHPLRLHWIFSGVHFFGLLVYVSLYGFVLFVQALLHQNLRTYIGMSCQAKAAQKLACSKFLDFEGFVITDTKDLLKCWADHFQLLGQSNSAPESNEYLQESKRKVNEYHLFSYDECDNVLDTESNVRRWNTTSNPSSETWPCQRSRWCLSRISSSVVQSFKTGSVRSTTWSKPQSVSNMALSLLSRVKDMTPYWKRTIGESLIPLFCLKC